MKSFITTIFMQVVMLSVSFGQYDEYTHVLSGGTNFSTYLGKGEGDNYFSTNKPGFQLEYALNYGEGFEWILWGIAHYNTYNYVEESKVQVKFWIPYYTEFSFYQIDRKNPLFVFFGYDYVRMGFPNMEKPDSHHNITFGGGWNLKLSNKVFLQFKLKPYFVIGNSIGQWFGVNSMVNIHIGVKE